MDDNYEVFDHQSGVFLVIKNDQPMLDPNGQALLFYRRQDAENHINSEIMYQLAYQQWLKDEEERAFDRMFPKPKVETPIIEMPKKKWFRRK